MVCLKADEDEINRLMETSDLSYSAFHDSDIPEMEWTAVAFYPIGRERGKELFSHLSLA